MTPRLGPIARQRRDAIRRCALKRWLRAHGIKYSAYATYNESELRKLVRDNSARVGGAT